MQFGLEECKSRGNQISARRPPTASIVIGATQLSPRICQIHSYMTSRPHQRTPPHRAAEPGSGRFSLSDPASKEPPQTMRKPLDGKAFSQFFISGLPDFVDCDQSPGRANAFAEWLIKDDLTEADPSICCTYEGVGVAARSRFDTDVAVTIRFTGLSREGCRGSSKFTRLICRSGCRPTGRNLGIHRALVRQLPRNEAHRCRNETGRGTHPRTYLRSAS